MVGGIEKACEKYKFPKNCHYGGVVPYAEIPDFLEDISILALPSHSEGLPNSVLEAYSAGRPVIVTPQSVPPELPVFGWTLGHNVQNWADTLRKVASGYPGNCQNLGLYARAFFLTSENKSCI